MRDYILLYINGERHELHGASALMSLSDYLRYDALKAGTKVVCSEGDCGACSVMYAPITSLENGKLKFKAINSCITFMYLLDGAHVVTVEGFKEDDQLHPVQQSMVDHFGAQCGYCTPGIVTAMVGMVEDCKDENKTITKQKAKNYLTGNLCRCTGYEPIIKACESIDVAQVKTLSERYSNDEMIKELSSTTKTPVYLKHENVTLSLPVTLESAVNAYKDGFKITSGSTDIGVLVNKDRHTKSNVMSLVHIPELYTVEELDDAYRVGARVSLTHLQKYLEDKMPEFSNLLDIFASPQIKNKATLIGNVANASPIGDTIPFLMVNEAVVEVLGEQGSRLIKMTEFYKGYKDLNIKPGELITHIHIKKDTAKYKLYKTSIRKDLDISAVTFGARYEVKQGQIESFRLSYGGVAATVLRLDEVENMLAGNQWSEEVFSKAAQKVYETVKPLSDVRGSSEFRKILSRNLLMKCFSEGAQA